MPNLSKFSNIPSGNHNNNFAMPKAKLRDFSPIDTKQYFPNQEFLGDVFTIFSNKIAFFLIFFKRKILFS